MRYNHFISLVTKMSRRKADKAIGQGLVKVNGVVIGISTVPPRWILECRTMRELLRNYPAGFEVSVNGKLVKGVDDKFSAVVYNKPRGELVSREDVLGRRLVYDSLGSRFREFMYVGRLDFASEGLLILSDSKEVVSKLMHAKLDRVYIVKIDSAVDDDMVKAIEHGVSLNRSRAGGHACADPRDMHISPARLKVIKSGRISKLKLTINEGKNREIRRLFAHFKVNVLDIKRIRYGFVSLNALPTGKIRYFTSREYRQLRYFMGGQESRQRCL